MSLLKDVFLILLVSGVTHSQNINFTLGNLGEITGKTVQTKVYPKAPYSGRDYYTFRNIPYAYPLINKDRFKQSKIKNDTKLSDEGAYDATKDGPLCLQGQITPDSMNNLTNTVLKVLIAETLCNMPGSIPLCFKPDDPFLSAILQIFELILEVESGLMHPDKTVGQLLYDWLDISLAVSEDCLQLSVSTPWKPDGTEKKDLPILFFIHGGGFYAGTHIKMSSERFGSWEDVIVVGINYRLGPLGFLCLDTDEAAGNMGMLDMVVALEWVHQYIGYFGGNASRITIFGESAGSAAINHLLLSKETNGLFSQGIGQSGSALAAWAFDEFPEKHAKEIANLAGCNQENHDDLVNCLRDLPAEDVSKAFAIFKSLERKNADLGFGGSIPCSQTKGARKFYDAALDETPASVMFKGNYNHVPLMFGANSYEGSYVYAEMFNSYLAPNNLTEDEHFLTYDFIPTLLGTVGVDNSYAIEEMIRDEYFEEWQLGNLTSMRPGVIDLFSVFFLKASSYKTIQENSEYANSFWYSFDYIAAQKSVFHLLFLNNKAEITEPGACHAEELLYMFDVELPLVLCDLAPFMADVLPCIGQIDECVKDDSDFRKRWHYCVKGELTEEELEVSSTIVQMWTNFAVGGSPGFNLEPWSLTSPNYISIGQNVSLKKDYTQEYHVAQNDFLNSVATTEVPTTTTTTTTTTSTSSRSFISVTVFLIVAGNFIFS